jgi:crotonobetainyl-CoA:carnitine CoA-transferase CaiB-like acyl-CoA transferase
MPESDPSDPGQSLAGIRVLEVSRLVPGALVGWWLAALGAEVVKVEEPNKGDYMREIPPFLGGRGLMHQVLDRGKKSVALDLRDDTDRSRLLSILPSADVVIDGNRPSSLAHGGLDYRSIRTQHPGLIICSVTGYGQNGPLAALASHGFSIDTLAGVSPIIENPDGSRTLGWESSSTIGIETGTLSAVIAVMAALITARTSGKGAWIDVSLWDAAVQSNRFAMTWALAGESPLRMHEGGPLYGAYVCGDGRSIWFAALEAKFWRRFCAAVDRPEWAERWSGEGAIGFGTDDLRRELEALFRTRTATQWIDLFQTADIPGNPILSAHDVAEHPHFAARDLVDPATRATAVPTIGAAPVWLDGGRRLGHGMSAAPEVGADTEQIIADWSGIAHV